MFCFCVLSHASDRSVTSRHCLVVYFRGCYSVVKLPTCDNYYIISIKSCQGKSNETKTLFRLIQKIYTTKNIPRTQQTQGFPHGTQINNPHNLYPHKQENHHQFSQNGNFYTQKHPEIQKYHPQTQNLTTTRKNKIPPNPNQWKNHGVPKRGYRSPINISHKHAHTNTTRHTSIKSKKK